MSHIIPVGSLESFLIAASVLFTGHCINAKLSILKRFNIPEPITGGLVVSAFITVLHFNQIELKFNLPLQSTFMLMFFATVGLSANYTQMLKGGFKIFVFLMICSVFIVVQNAIGVSLATLLGLDPLIGLIAGSITLSGGHGTGAAWSQTLSGQYGLHNALEIAMASATFGLIMGGIIGSPVAQRLIVRNKLKSEFGRGDMLQPHSEVVTYSKSKEDDVTARKVIEMLFIMILCVTGAKYLAQWVSSFEISWLTIPDFVFALFIGVVVTNLLEVTKTRLIDIDTVDMLGTVSLSLFLAMALMSLKLWHIFDLAIPILIILAVQTIAIVLFSYWVTFRLMRANYDAAVIVSGHCGFGLGAMPTAVMNMSSVVNRYGPSPQAFMVVPIVGAFFIDIVNLIILQTYLSVMG
ncbi:MAG: sodium/glutamate symporter [Shewanella sp.]|nr:sodium/glutamate symporter [Shewanella sp.]MCF1429449.1 sodium/glutamate symporter [Shewanella sp.]MCF1437442.1 sodium/glutamate symporter [Shewanella sp.]MCF1456640.1 sodium/glutamate symporter [Shewanella sp.]